MRESTYALKLHISDFAAMATLKVKNAMFFKVKESCIKPAAGYRSTEIRTERTCIETLILCPKHRMNASDMLGMLHLEVEADKVSKSLTGT